MKLHRRDQLIIWTATLVAVVAIIFAFCNSASAEWGLYVNRDNKAWRIEQTFAFESTTERNCKSAARALWATGTVLGVTCQEYSATSYADRGPVRPPQSQAPALAEQDGSRGRKDAAVDFYRRGVESARESAKGHTGNRAVYSNGDSYNSREIKDAEAALGRALKENAR